MAKEEKKSILRKLFGNSGGCSCGVEIVEQEEVKNEDTSKSKKTGK